MFVSVKKQPELQQQPLENHAVTGPSSPRGNDVAIRIDDEYEMLVRESLHPTSSNEPKLKSQNEHEETVKALIKEESSSAKQE